MKIEEFVGKKVRIIITLGDVTVPYEGILKYVNKWVILETKKGKMVINADSIVLIEEIK
jgi:hypothetical protein